MLQRLLMVAPVAIGLFWLILIGVAITRTHWF